MRQALIKFLTLSSFIVAGISNADVFNTLNYSGRIVNYDGSPKTGSIELEVNFYNSITSDTSVSSKDYSKIVTQISLRRQTRTGGIGKANPLARDKKR